MFILSFLLLIYPMTEDEKNTINIVKQNMHTVVNVSNLKLARSFFMDDPIQIPAGTGSGFFWDRQGHIVTNYHVVAGGDNYVITMANSKEQYRAKLVGVAPEKDIAVLKIDRIPPQMNYVSPGTSATLQVGQKAIAIGNPFGFDSTVTTGIVSALGRQIQGVGQVKIYDMIQTDASINPGNSGGPLFDSDGKLIGMNTIIVSASGSSSGVGFAVPIDAISKIVPQLITHGKVIRPVLGIEVRDDLTSYFNIKEGVLIVHVNERGPSFNILRGMVRDRNGRFRLGDILLAINEEKINTFDEIFHALEKRKVGDTVTVTILRDGKHLKLQIKLASL